MGRPALSLPAWDIRYKQLYVQEIPWREVCHTSLPGIKCTYMMEVDPLDTASSDDNGGTIFMTRTLPDRDASATIHAAEVRRMVEAGTPVRLLDVRTPGEFVAGHIDGAVNIPLDQLASVAPRLADTEGTVVVICQSGGRAEQACRTLTQFGVEAVVMAEGINAWNSLGAQTRTAKGKWSLERQVRFVAGLIVLTAILASIVWEPARYLAGMVGAGLVFAAVTNTCAMGMLLAKLPYNKGTSCAVDTAVDTLRR